MRVVVIGAGVFGSLIARELTKYDVEVILIEKNLDVGWGVTKANSAIVHAGYDDPPGSVRAQFCAKGNMMYEDLSKELDFDFKRIGSFVVAFNEEELEELEKLLKQGEENGVPGLTILERDEILSMEPNLNPEIKYALYAPTAGITEPWMVAIAAVENGVKNGLKLILGEKVVGFVKSNGRITELITNKSHYHADVVINCAGLHGDEISKMAGAEYVPLHPRKGEYILLDKKLQGLVRRVIFPTPTKISKGILVLPTVDGGILLGPTAEDLPEDMKDRPITTKEGLEKVREFTKRLVPSLDFSLTVKTFSGLRPESPQKDFFIKASDTVKNFVNVIATRSPGLTAAPAVAKYVVEELIQEKMKLPLIKKKDFDPTRERIPHYSSLPIEKWQEEIKKDPRAGRLVCFCNEVTEKEIVEAIRRGARTLDGIKFRTRAMFGRCQGGFCMVRILKILEKELEVDMSEIRMKSENSWVVDGKVRE
ncbi:NAD(P)/FAD-dependent oxidoreductase [Thermotoga sp. KOL6]|uniref:NAD(P)/FAD-dependent oxidoreductase n=1 Tax=Thermotoga sp. KOL6 TaxID=126741 RepID=UPI000C7688BD|nr:NAD(P)/FAD-dependent oxidoreductase [Thermotoga sp. KOL6]PLV60491.1 FAD/NAD(P)-binding oxidoreductase [Thermotoga sp. KOL6]